MILNNNSWHRRLYTWVYEVEPGRISLCPYFWSVVLACIVTPFILLGMGIIRLHSWLGTSGRIKVVIAFLTIWFGFIGYIIIYALITQVIPWLIRKGLWFDLYWTGVIAGIIVGACALVIGNIIGVMITFEKYRDYAEAHPRQPKPEKVHVPRPERQPRQPGILMSFLKAKKDKVCPIIEWE